MFDVLPSFMRNFIDMIFDPPITFLDMVSDYLASISLIAGRGINLSHYFSFFSYLPQPFMTVINSLVASIVFLGILICIQAIIRMYFFVKGAIKWW